MNVSRITLVSFLSFGLTTNAFIPSPGTHTSVHPKLAFSTTTKLELKNDNDDTTERRRFLQQSISVASSILTIGGVIPNTSSSWAAEEESGGIQNSLDVNNFLRSGMDTGGPMGVSSQAGKSRPQTGVFFRDGTDVARDKRTGSVSAEIVLGTKSNPTPAILNYNSPWPLATGSVYDIECRDAKTGDGAFVSVVMDTTNTQGKSIQDLSNDFFIEELFKPTGRFSFYGSPTNIKVVRSSMKDDMRLMELSFSNLSQSTQTELPRKAMIAAIIPKNTENVVMLVGSASAARWKKTQGVKESVVATVSSFRVLPSPKSNLKVRVKQRGGDPIF